MTKQEFVEELATILNEDAAKLTPGAELGWDSTGLLGVISLLDGELEMQLDVDRLRECKTVQDLLTMVGDKLE
ncbi:MAG: acyl carrier protein [Planctomycetota bacterium]|nr:acyl carrier protein [Planctomycetota bacterium]